MVPGAADSLMRVLASAGFSGQAEPVISDLARELELLSFNPGDVLIHERDLDDSLYIILEGRVGVTAQGKALADLGPGETVGELALLTGEPRLCTVTAIESVRAARLPRAAFERWVECHPEAAEPLFAAMIDRLRKARLAFALHLNDLFDKLDPPVLRDLESELQMVTLASGQVLFRQGEPGDSLIIVVNGRLRVIAAKPGEERPGEGYETELGSGETVGEMALVTGHSRTATVVAIRDSNVAVLARAGYERLLLKHPLAMSRIVAGGLVTKLQNMNEGVQPRQTLATVALIPASRDVPLALFAAQLEASFGRIGETLLLSSESVDRMLGRKGTAQVTVEHGRHVTMIEWLHKQEQDHDYVIYQVDPDLNPEPSEWSRRCIRQSDQALIVGLGSGNGEIGELERHLHPGQRSTLALLQTTTEPTRTVAWIENRPAAYHHHVRLGEAADFDRLARFLTGRAVGVALGGGFARGLAHLGVIRAMHDLGMPIDAIGGSSMGSLIAALWNQGWDFDRIVAETRAGCEESFNDMTFPFTAFKKGKKFSDLIQSFYGDRQIEDLFLPYFCVSANLNRAEAVVHRRGSLAKAVLASTRAPAIFPPVVYDGELHVDGGVLNNVPVDIMKSFVNGGTVIGVDASPPHELNLMADYGNEVDGWRAMNLYFNPFMKKKKVPLPNLLVVLMRTIEFGGLSHKRNTAHIADVYLRPPLLKFKRTDFFAAAEIAQVGYDHARQEIEAWLNRSR
jgi:predicted acylesterase/phospholipase RssA/CRP-like cAMP-binding protein